MKRSGPLPPVSEKRKRTNRERTKMRKEHFGEERPRCAVRWDGDCTGWADALHELKKRSQGGSLTDPNNAVPCCNRCNSKIEDHPDEAHRRGFVVKSWEG